MGSTAAICGSLWSMPATARSARFADRIRLLCYGYDPVRGIYTERITTLLEIAAGATLLAMAGGIFAMTSA